MKKFTYFMLSFFLFTSLILAGCGGKSDKIKVIEVTHSIFYAPLYVAMSQNYFKDEGIKIDLTNGNGADLCMNALIAGSADIGLMGPEAAVYVAAQGKQDLPKIFGQLTKRDGSFLIGRTPNDNFSWTDVANKQIIAGRRGGFPAMTLEYALKKNGIIDGTNVTLRYDIQFQNTVSAFIGGTGDYVTAFEPTASQLVSNNQGHILASVGEEAGEVPFTAFMAFDSFINKKRSTVKGFLRAIVKGYYFIVNSDIEKVIDALVPQFGDSSRDSIKKSIESYRQINAWKETPVMYESDYNRLLTIIRDAGELSQNVPFANIVDNSIATEVMSEIVGA